MVAQNPLFRGRWTLKKFQATVVNDIWPEVLFFTLVAVMVYLVDRYAHVDLGISPQLLTVLGTVLGLVISFRTSSAYERYQDGRKMWANIGTASRNLAQMIWIHVPVDRSQTANLKTQTVVEATIEKKSMINLLQAFAVSVKHFLRDEPGTYYEDLYPLICFLPRYANAQNPGEKLPLWHTHDGFEHGPSKAPTRPPSVALLVSQGEERADGKSVSSWFKPGQSSRSRRNSFDPERALPQVESEHPLLPARNPPETTVADYIPLFRFFRFVYHKLSRRVQSKNELREQRRRLRKKGHGIELVESNVPFELLLVLSNYTAYLMKNGLLQPAIAAGVTTNLTQLQDTLANLERICNTPLPFAYQAHLRMSLWLYLLFLPFQVFPAFDYLVIPGTAFASFLLLGFLEIGQEIENPFNYDLNDLDLDHFCLSLQRELHEITAHTNPDPSEFLFIPLNQPFAPADRRGADELVKTGPEYQHPDNKTPPGMQSLRKTLVGSWREVDLTTRHIE